MKKRKKDFTGAFDSLGLLVGVAILVYGRALMFSPWAMYATLAACFLLVFHSTQHSSSCYLSVLLLFGFGWLLSSFFFGLDYCWLMTTRPLAALLLVIGHALKLLKKRN